ncbi:hypothetical protein [Brucella rhizosphaerae]|uniref:hypothetical protein n=1 Tax=Brucella rhizosphaerae TaxID=571254 RepID=UPI00046399DC|nr:hypothetical protein [Brucella rhizosphaerae]
MNMHTDLNPAAIAAASIGHNSLAEWSSGHMTLAPYESTPETEAIIDEVVALHRQRQFIIKNKTKLILAAKAAARSMICTDADFVEDTSTDKVTAFGSKRVKLSSAAEKRVDAAFAAAIAEIQSGEIVSRLAATIRHFPPAIAAFEAQDAEIKKAMEKLVRKLPIYNWVKSVKGFGDISFATIVGECGDIGTYKSVSAVWKRLGLAVIDGNRQGTPGKSATADDWIAHGYNRQRRSVSWNARQHVIGGMGKWRPSFGEDVRCNRELTYYQQVYAERARYESEKLGLPVTESDKGKESYKMHAAMRAHRYTEKRLIKHLYLEWRRATALAA